MATPEGGKKADRPAVRLAELPRLATLGNLKEAKRVLLDVGGGYRDDFLSAISLRRMIEIISKRTSLKIDQDRFDELDRKLKGESEQDNKKCVHDERRWAKPQWAFLNSSLTRKWPRKEFMASEHFVDRSIRMLDGQFVVRGNTRSQYTLPDDLKSLMVF
jgi:hypothetical protein